MQIYHYHPVTFDFVGTSAADVSPLDPDVYLVPANATQLQPPVFNLATETCTWNGSDWLVAQIPQPEPAEPADPAEVEAQRVASLWQAATAYEQSFIANMAIGLLTMGVMLQKPKALAISEWSSKLWNGPDGYYARKSNGSTNCDYTNIGPMPYSIPELSAEVLG